MNNKLKVLLLCISFHYAQLAHAETRLNVVGLFSGKALVMINGGAPTTMAAGQTKNAVKLISANSQTATFLVEGKTKTLGLGQAAAVAGGPASAVNAPVNLFADSAGHFFGNMTINGTSLKYVVDTGATSVAMNSADAKHAGIDFTKGEHGMASTASGTVKTYQLKVNTLKIGTIELNNVDVSVIEGGFPEVVLLGMTALNRLEMKRENSIMTLTKKY